MRALFWLSAGLIYYAYVVYPLLVILLGSLLQGWRDFCFALSRGERRARETGQLPFVTLLFAAHNEAAVIADKLRNCAALDYPADQIEIVVGCDGCDDGTADIIRRADLPNVRLFEFGQRSGKPATLNRLAPLARGEIVVFSDANTMFHPSAIRSLVRHFAHPEVGCVCGELRLGVADCDNEGLYWRYETFLKFNESRLNMLVGANGGIFAIRRELYTPLPEGAIIDDFLIGMSVRARGRRVVYDTEATGREDAGDAAQEFRRRVRIGAGNLHALRHTWRLLNPAQGRLAFSYASHKVCRWLVPLAMIGALASALALADEPVYGIAAAAQLAAYGAAGAGWALERRGRCSRALGVPCYFVSMNLALLIGFVSYLRGRQSGVWRPTARPVPKARSHSAGA